MRPSTRHCIRTGTRREHFLALCRRLLPQVWCRCSNVVQAGRRARFGRRRRRGCRHRLGRRRRRGGKLASYSSSSSAPDRRRERGGSSRLSNLYRRDAVFFFVVNKFGGIALSERQRRLARRRTLEFRFNQRDGDFRRVFARRRWRREERSTRSIRRRGNRLWVRRVRRGVHLLRKEKRIQTWRSNRATRAGAPTRTSENSRGGTENRRRVDDRIRRQPRRRRLAGSQLMRRRRRRTTTRAFVQSKTSPLL